MSLFSPRSVSSLKSASAAAIPSGLSFEEARRLVERHAASVSAGAGEDARRSTTASEIETLDLLAATGRVLAEGIVADRDFPPFARATRDGYAVRAEDVAEVPARLEVVGEIKAGDWPEQGVLSVGRGQAVGIMTGAPLPQGADAVVMVEYTSITGGSPPKVAKDATLEWGTHGMSGRGAGASGTGALASGSHASGSGDRPSGSSAPGDKSNGRFVEVRSGVVAGENFVPRGAEARAGQLLLERGRRLDHAGVALAASVGKSRVSVFRKPRVVVVSTGDEVVEIDAAPGPAEIRNSNSYSLAAQIQNAGGEAVRLGIAPDERGQLRALIEEGLKCDLLLLTGGVSMGKYDLVEQVLGELGAEFYFTGVKIQPGRPVVFGACEVGGRGSDGSCSHSNAAKDAALEWSTPESESGTSRLVSGTQESARDSVRKYFFGLPGNPVSTMVTFELFARPMVEALAGMTARRLIFLRARLKSEIRTKTGLTRFLPAVVGGEFENAEVELARWQGSGDIAALARANCYVVIAPDRERIDAGEWVPVLPL